MTYIYRLLADAVVSFHFGFVLFVVLGGLLALRWRRLAWLHLPAAVWGALIELRGWVCPLTPLENWLRRRAGAAGYSEGFVEHYLVPVLYPPGLTPAIQIVLGVSVVALNSVIYWRFFRRRGSRPGCDGGTASAQRRPTVGSQP